MPGKHSALGGSSSSRWLYCTASVAAIKAAKESGVVPKESTSVYAEEGTAAHDLLEMCVKRKMDAEDFYMKTFNKFTVNENMVEAVQTHIDRVKQITKNYNKNFLIFLERRFSLTKYVGYDCGGSADITIFDKRKSKLFVDDYKHGKGDVVEAEGNTQTRLYGLGMVRDLRKENIKIKDVDLTIVQPRASHEDGPIRTEELNANLIKKWGRQVLKPAVKNIISGETEYAPSEKACKWCPLNGVACPASDQHSTELMQADFSESNDLIPIEMLTFEEAEQIVLNESKINNWQAGVKQRLQAAIDGGQQSKYFKIVKSTGNRAYSKKQSRIIKKLKKNGVPESVYLVEPGLKSPAQLEASLASLGHMTKKDAVSFIEGVVERPERGFRLDSIKSGKESVASTTQNDFADI